MRVYVDYNKPPTNDDAYQIFIEETSGRIVSMEELNDRIIVDSYEDKYGKLVLVLTDHTFHEKL